jgi:hypothetical protein
MKPPLRTKSVGTKVSEAEFALLEERARGAGMRLAEWVREALLAAPVEPGASSGVDSGEVALGEILALRSLLLNLHFRAAKGEPVVEAEMRGLIERDTTLGKTGLGHPGTNMRDEFPVCSVHLNINPGTGVNGVPVSGEFHYDLFNPLKSLPGGPQTGDIPLMPFHAAADVGPDILIKKAHTSWTGNQECVTK